MPESISIAVPLRTPKSEDPFLFSMRQTYVDVIETHPLLEGIKVSFKYFHALTEPNRRNKIINEATALLLIGGDDLGEKTTKQPRHHNQDSADEKRDAFEIWALEKALRLGIPIEGHCRGAELINVFFGGTLIPELSEVPGAIRHMPKDKTYYSQRHMVNWHEVTIDNKTDRRLATLPTISRLPSANHQGLDRVPSGFLVVGHASDKQKEMIISEGEQFIFGSIPHSEALMMRPEKKFRDLAHQMIGPFVLAMINYASQQ